MLGLYVHIPFCSAICNYCNFNRGLYEPALKARYVDALLLEIQGSAGGGAADTIYFGGGTPSLLEPLEIGRIIAACRDAFEVAPDAEVTLEANPETVSAERLAGFRAAGVNRLSFGVQSFRDEELARLSRLHSASRASEAFAHTCVCTAVAPALHHELPDELTARHVAEQISAAGLARPA